MEEDLNLYDDDGILGFSPHFHRAICDYLRDSIPLQFSNLNTSLALPMTYNICGRKIVGAINVFTPYFQ